ncbi:MAG: iron chelate uptake ABC transporter family permease subunit [Oscillospiraceae bacterium]
MNSDLSQSANNDSGTAYRRNQVKSCCFLGILFLSLLIALVLSLRAGSYNTPIAELVKGVFGKAADDKINLVVRNNRLPRICTALIAGAGLGLAGCVMQAILRNPLASASTLGVSQGAGFGAAFAIIVLNMGAVGNLGSVAIPRRVRRQHGRCTGYFGPESISSGFYTGNCPCRHGDQRHVFRRNDADAIFRR